MAYYKKIFFIVFFMLLVIFSFSTTVRAEWTDTDIEEIQNALATITGNQGVVITQLQGIGIDVTDCETMLNRVNDTLKTLKTDTSNIDKKLTSITNTINLINTNITNIYNTLNANQQELLEQMKKDNENVMNELSQIKDIISGSNEDTSDLFEKNQSLYHLNKEPSSLSGTYKVSNDGYSIQSISYRDATTNKDYTFEKGLNYTIKISKILTSSSNTARVYYTFDDVAVGKDVYLNYAGTFSQANYSFSFTAKSDKVTFFITNTTAFWGNMVRYTISSSRTGVTDILNNVDDSINNTTNTIKDDNVDTNGFQFATNDTQNPTTDGFNSLFTAVYNAFCSTSSAPLTVTLPYINQTFSIQPNLVSNAMQKSGLGFIASLIQSFYFYCVCLFIYKDINKIVEHVKSGNLTADCGNVKTEVL